MGSRGQGCLTGEADQSGDSIPKALAWASPTPLYNCTSAWAGAERPQASFCHLWFGYS